MFNLSPEQWASLAKLHLYLDDVIGWDMNGNIVDKLTCIHDALPNLFTFTMETFHLLLFWQITLTTHVLDSKLGMLVGYCLSVMPNHVPLPLIGEASDEDPRPQL